MPGLQSLHLCLCDILTNELRVRSYELISLRAAFIARVTSYLFVHMSYKLLFIARIRSYSLHTSYELLFITRVASYFLYASYEL